MEKSNEVYVTYKWLFATAISILSITLIFIYFAFSGITKSLDSKADIKWVEQRIDNNKARIDVLTNHLEKMGDKQDEMLKELYNIRGLIKMQKKNDARDF